MAAAPWCEYCDCLLTPFGGRFAASVDHRRARYWAGGDIEENLALACQRCNRKKSDDPIECFARPVVRGGKLRYVSEVPFQEDDAMLTKNTVGFNYAILLAPQRELAQDAASKIRDLVRLSATTIVSIGKLLSSVHGVLREEHYAAWLKSEFGWNYHNAWHYEKAAAQLGDAGESIEKFQPGAVRLLCNGKVPDKAITESIERARKGEIISRPLASKLIRKHLPPGQAHPDLRRPIYEMNRALKGFDLDCLLALPMEDRMALADKLAALVDQLRQIDAKPASKRVGQQADDAKPARRRRALAIA